MDRQALLQHLGLLEPGLLLRALAVAQTMGGGVDDYAQPLDSGMGAPKSVPLEAWNARDVRVPLTGRPDKLFDKSNVTVKMPTPTRKPFENARPYMGEYAGGDDDQTAQQDFILRG